MYTFWYWLPFLCSANSFNLIYPNFGCGFAMKSRLEKLYTKTHIYDSNIDALTSVHGWQQTWDYYNNQDLEKVDTIHCISGGLINAMIHLDANPNLKCDKLILESPVWTTVDAMILFNHIYYKSKHEKKYYLTNWKLELDKTIHPFTDKLLKPFSEEKLNDVKYFINNLLVERCNEIYIIYSCDDDFIIHSDVQLLTLVCNLKNITCHNVHVTSKHAMYSVLRTQEFKNLF